VWTVASSFIPDETFTNGLLEFLALGGGFISACSGGGYLWAGKGFAHD
jgi:hypothetical protein